jgi:hypothetical protein
MRRPLIVGIALACIVVGVLIYFFVYLPGRTVISESPIPVVLITGYSDFPNMPFPEQMREPLSTGVPTSENTIRLEPWGEEGDSHSYLLPYSSPSSGRQVVDIVIQTRPVEGEYIVPLSFVEGIRSTISWMVGPTVDMEDIENYPVLPQCRFFYINKTTDVEIPQGNYTRCETALRLVIWEEDESLPYLQFENSSDEPAYVTYEIYDAGIIDGFPEHWQWLASYYFWRHETEDWAQWQKTSESWNLEHIPFSDLTM